MVDRYLLPIPKSKNMRAYMRLKNKPLWSLPYIIGILTLSFQINRYLSIRSAASKPGGYYIDWGHRDAPGKVRYFSSQA